MEKAKKEEQEEDKDEDEDEDARRLSNLRSRRGSVASMVCSTHTVSEGPDAVERLSSWISDLITPFVFLCVFIVGLPLWFLYDFALPLFLGEYDGACWRSKDGTLLTSKLFHYVV